MTDESLIDEIRAKAFECGVPRDRLGAFILWIGNEVWEGREVPNFMVLRERTPELVRIYKAEEATGGEEPVEPSRKDWTPHE